MTPDTGRDTGRPPGGPSPKSGPGSRNWKVGNPRDRGAASILVLAIGLFVVAAGLAGAAIGDAGVGRHQARTAADLGALAGAARAVYGEDVACARAREFVAANGGRMTACSVRGLEIVVRVLVEVRPLPGLVRQVGATARAGPVYEVDV